MLNELADNPWSRSRPTIKISKKRKNLLPFLIEKHVAPRTKSEATPSEVYDSGRDAWMTLGGTYVPLFRQVIDEGHQSSTCIDGLYNSAHTGKLLCDLLMESFLIYSVAL